METEGEAMVAEGGREAPELLSMTEMARRLDLPESTLRYYCKRFSRYLPFHGDGRSRRYAPEALQVLQFIAGAMRHNKNATAVDLLLRNRLNDPGQKNAVSFEAAVSHTGVLSQAVTVPLTPSNPQTVSAAAEAGASAPVMGGDAEFWRQAGQSALKFMQAQTEAMQELGKAVALINDKLERLAVPPDGNKEASALLDNFAALRHRTELAADLHGDDMRQVRKWLAEMAEVIHKSISKDQ